MVTLHQQCQLPVHGRDLLLDPEAVQALTGTWGQPLSLERAREPHDLVGGWMLPVRPVLDATSPTPTAFATGPATEIMQGRFRPLLADRVRPLMDRGADLPSWLLAPAARFHLLTGDARRATRIARSNVWRGTVHARDRTELLVISPVALRSLHETDLAVEDVRRAHAMGRHTGSLEPWLLVEDTTRAQPFGILEGSGASTGPTGSTGRSGVRRIMPLSCPGAPSGKVCDCLAR